MRALSPSFALVRGPAPIVLVAPHGGRRDIARRPWTSGGLKTNDLHTATLTMEIAATMAASALVNVGVDRNDIDLNRVSTAHDAAPEFLEALAGLVDQALSRHRRAVVLTVHGWNVLQAAVDVGLGYRPGRHSPHAHPGPSASAEFVGGPLQRLGEALEGRGITVAFGARYPARARENLLQLFTRRYLDDPRPLVRRLAQLGRHCDGAQLELGVPLRWPGPWRRRLLEGLVDALPALAGGTPVGATAPAARPEPSPGPPRSLEFVGEELCGLVATDGAGARFLLFENDGSLVLFTGERIGGEAEGHVYPLALLESSGGGHRVRYEGPVLRFPDTAPFLDLEAGLARATLDDLSCTLAFRPHHTGCPFGVLEGFVTMAGRSRHLTAIGVADHDESRPHATWRTALALGSEEHLLVRRQHGESTGYLCRRERHVPVADVRHARDGSDERLEVVLSTGESRAIRAVVRHRLPVVRGAATPPACAEFTSYGTGDPRAPAGWGFSLRPTPPVV